MAINMAYKPSSMALPRLAGMIWDAAAPKKVPRTHQKIGIEINPYIKDAVISPGSVAATAKSHL